LKGAARERRSFFVRRDRCNLFVSMSVYRNFSNKSAMSFRQTGNICRPGSAIFSRMRQILPGSFAPGKIAPERFFRRRTKSMFKRI
jgi:hypothetical protein